MTKTTTETDLKAASASPATGPSGATLDFRARSQPIVKAYPAPKDLTVQTPDGGTLAVSEGDFVITEDDGTMFALAPEFFRRHFEPVSGSVSKTPQKGALARAAEAEA